VLALERVVLVDLVGVRGDQPGGFPDGQLFGLVGCGFAAGPDLLQVTADGPLTVAVTELDDLRMKPCRIRAALVPTPAQIRRADPL
jgi:hypothetical protein